MNKNTNDFSTSVQSLDQQLTVYGPTLSVIVPFRDEGIAPWFLTRIGELCCSFPKTDQIEFIVVDSGSVSHASSTCRDICRRSGVRYLYHDSVGDVFSAGDARDFGAKHATGRALTFVDLDLRVAPDFWPRLLTFMQVFGISDYKKRFFAVPALYLTEEGTLEFLAADEPTRFQDFYLRWMHGDTQSIIQMAPCSSMGVIDRLHYLSIGGHNPVFRGHGFEDFELYHRLVEEEGRMPKPDSYLKETRSWETATYNGFRARLALLGRPAMLSNLFVVHLWHPRPRALSFYDADKMKTVRRIWPDIFTDFEKSRNHPEALVCATQKDKKVLVLGQKNTNISRCLRDAIPLLGNPIYMSEKIFLDSGNTINLEAFKTFIQYQHIELIVFNGPYGNLNRLEIYNWCRKENFPYLTFERGALPDSWFFDKNGFNADSNSYARHFWDHPLKTEQASKVSEYIHRTLKADPALEKQGERIGARALAERLGVGGRKVLFIPLQRPSDTVTTYFAGSAQNCTFFLETLEETARLLKQMGWLVLCKRHPLEIGSPDLNNIEYVPHDTHFLDLLELSDSVALINSGVGVYAMMMGKPCYIFGKAFYAIDGVNMTVDSMCPTAVCDQIIQGHKVNPDTVLRFIHYLTEEFYSFGTPHTISGKEEDGSRRTRTTAIDFYDLKIPNKERLLYKKETWPKLSKSAPIFERYKLDIVQKNRLAAEAGNKPAPMPAAQQHTSLASLAKPAVPQLSRSDSGHAKFRKLRRDPRAFFRDTRNPLLRPLRHFFA